MTLYKINHRTTYKYAYPVSAGDHVACLKPRPSPHDRLLQNTLVITPTPTILTERFDYFGNLLSFFTIDEPHKELIVESCSEVVVEPNIERTQASTLGWECSAKTLSKDQSLEALEAYQFQFESPRIRLRADFAEYALQSFLPGRPMRESLLDLTSRIHTDFRFDSRVTTVRTPVEEVFKKRHGVCQDFAHLQIACLRSINVAARYVSGYLRTYSPPGRPRLVGADASHAWVSAYSRDLGWIDVDPTNNLAPTDGHVTVAWGRDYSDVSPLRGLILGGGSSALKVEVDMEPVNLERVPVLSDFHARG